MDFLVVRVFVTREVLLRCLKLSGWQRSQQTFDGFGRQREHPEVVVSSQRI